MLKLRKEIIHIYKAESKKASYFSTFCKKNINEAASPRFLSIRLTSLSQRLKFFYFKKSY